jgi:hypothetical protein
MIEEITSNPNRSDPFVNKDGTPTPQLISWFDDLDLKINELANERNRLDEFAKAALPSASENKTLQIYVTDDVGGETPAYSDGTDWRRYKDGNIIS